MPAKLFVPTGGFAGFAQQTPAVQALLKKKRAAKKRPAKKRRVTRAPAKKRPAKKRVATKGRLKKGSPAAKRRMAQLRKMRKS